MTIFTIKSKMISKIKSIERFLNSLTLRAIENSCVVQTININLNMWINKIYSNPDLKKRDASLVILFEKFVNVR